MANVKCLICGRETEPMPFGGYQHKDIVYCLYGCKSCKLRFIFPQPSPEESYQTYNNLDYWQSGDFAGDKTSHDIYKKYYKSEAERILKLVKKCKISTGNFLEIGCAQGDILEYLNPYFKKVIGLDISKEMVVLAKNKGLDVRQGTLEEIEISEKFDCVYMGDLVEHLHNPISFFKKLETLIGSDGAAIIEIPLTYNFYPVNIVLSPLVFLKNLINGKILKPPYLYFFNAIQREKNKKINHPPYHLLEFTPQAADNFVNAIGWKYIHRHVYAGQLKRKHFRLKNFFIIGLQLFFHRLTKFGTIFNLGDRMTVIIRPGK